MCACLVSLIPSPLTGSGNETRLHWSAITQWKERYVRCVLSDFCTTSDELARSWNEGIVRYKYVLESDSVSQIGELPPIGEIGELPWGTVSDTNTITDLSFESILFH